MYITLNRLSGDIHKKMLFCTCEILSYKKVYNWADDLIYITTLHTSIFIKAPSVERLPTKAIPHEMRISPAGH